MIFIVVCGVIGVAVAILVTRDTDRRLESADDSQPPEPRGFEVVLRDDVTKE